MIPRFWKAWLIVSSVLLMAFGLGIVLFPDLAKGMFGLLLYFNGSYIKNSFSHEANHYISLVHGVLGAVLFAWGLQMYLVIRGLFEQAQFKAWMTVSLPLVGWFIVDSTFSLVVGYWQNAILNCVLATMFAIPLIAIRRHIQNRV